MSGEGDFFKTFIIAEAGVNHNGDIGMAIKLVDAAADAGADAVKFQTFDPAALTTPNTGKAIYQKASADDGESQLDMLRRLTLPESAYQKLVERCGRRGIKFLSTPFDLKSLDFLVEQVGLNLLKLPSGAVTHGPLLLAASQTKLPIILSTGMSTLDEIALALGVLAFGYAGGQKPNRASFTSFDRDVLTDKVHLLHCTTEYPAPTEETNLRAMDTIAEHFGLPVGFSDHTAGIHLSVAAAARGAKIIEKHFTLDCGLPGPDHKASLAPEELTEMIRAVRDVTRALGSGKKQPTISETRNISIARYSIVAAKAIEAGEMLTETNMAVKRPGEGLSPMRWWDQVGKIALHDLEKDDYIDAAD